ncbi:MAG TPA: nitrate- and nitrite sensing domain-containing protein [Actinophytocola sp.]|nr:nitrate- and nitrite sensing domain-containing protein [Actinophytocola sp.]
MKSWSAALQWRNWSVQWRNWSLQRKLAMVLVVPVIGATVLGVLRVQGETELANSYAATKPFVELRARLLDTVAALQAERKEAVWRGDELDRFGRATDAQIERTHATVEAVSLVLDDDVTRRFRSVDSALGGLATIRRQVADEAEGHIALNAYNSVIGTVLDFDRTLVGRFPDVGLTNLSIALNKLQATREQVAVEQTIGLVALRNDILVESDRQGLIQAEARLDDSLTDLRAVAPDDLRQYYDKTVTGADVAKRGTMAKDASNPGTLKLPFDENAWNAPFDPTFSRMLDVSRHAADQLRDQATALANDFSRRAALAAATLIVIVLLAAGIAAVVARYLVRSVGSLRHAALTVAHSRLPEAVARIRAGEVADVGVEPVPLHTTEEFGQLARAFDAVHAQAVRSAAEEAGLRSNLATILTNLSRRSQSLVERQLRLMEQLEQNENDPDQLENLFKIDHLATRMRRNNENLMVLSGSGLRRRFTTPVVLPELLRAAVSEVEHYQRASIRSAPDVRIIGYAVGDLIRSVSELIENATKFSPPDSQVVVTSHPNMDGSLQIDILDEGVGMTDAELHDVNQRVAAESWTDVPVSRQLGLFVVGRLTARHGIQVLLRRRDDRGMGLCATVYLPAALVSADPSTVVPPDASALFAAEPEPEPLIPSARVPSDPAPVQVVPPADVTEIIVERLASAGIHVRLSVFPPATTPASILFGPNGHAALEAGLEAAPGADPEGASEAVPAEQAEEAFSWLGTAESAPSEPSTPPAPPREWETKPVAAQSAEPDGLPKRVPMNELSASLRNGKPTAGTPAAGNGSGGNGTAGKPDADRNRGFLSGFQAGIQASEDRRRSSEP